MFFPPGRYNAQNHSRIENAKNADKQMMPKWERSETRWKNGKTSLSVGPPCSMNVVKNNGIVKAVSWCLPIRNPPAPFGLIFLWHFVFLLLLLHSHLKLWRSLIIKDFPPKIWFSCFPAPFLEVFFFAYSTWAGLREEYKEPGYGKLYIYKMNFLGENCLIFYHFSWNLRILLQKFLWFQIIMGKNSKLSWRKKFLSK